MSDKELEILNRRFELTKGQWERYFEWKDSLPYKYYGMSSTGINIVFEENSLCTIVRAEREAGESIDLTEWDI
jgi:hypothetical protein